MPQVMTRHVKSSFFLHPAASASVAVAFWPPRSTSALSADPSFAL